MLRYWIEFFINEKKRWDDQRKDYSKEYFTLNNKIILDDSGSGQGVGPYLPLNELNKKKDSN